VNFIIDRDSKDTFRFAALQSGTAKSILNQFGLSTSDFETFILIENENHFTKSTAALKISQHLSGLWKILYIFLIVHKPVRDFLYDLIAKNRYKFFGKREVCRIPSEEEKRKFIL
jgi:predicted DCC family thiol-disulfide oxidoreductase YuxK